MTLIEIQQTYADRINEGIARWGHVKAHTSFEVCGGHAGRIAAGARRKAEKQLLKLGFSDKQIPQLLKDARDMATLERMSDAE